MLNVNLFSALFLTLVLVACRGGGGGGSNPIPATPITPSTNTSGKGDNSNNTKERQVTGVHFYTSNIALSKGEGTRLVLMETFTDGLVKDITLVPQVHWRSDNESVVKVDAGSVTSWNEGQANVTATINLAGHVFTASAHVAVGPAKITELHFVGMGEGESEIIQGFDKRYSIEATLSDKTLVDVTDKVNWTTSNPDVVSMNKGVAHGVSSGKATIGVEIDGKSAAIDVMVTEARAEKIVVVPQNAAQPIGKNQDYQATASLNTGQSINVTSQVDWTCTPPDIARFSQRTDQKITVSAHAKGEATIAAKASEQLVSSATLCVLDAAVAGLNISPARAELPEGRSQAFTAEATLTDGMVRDDTDTAEWSFSGDGLVKVDKGIVQALKEGQVTLMAESEGQQATAQLTILEPEVVKVSVSTTKTDIPLGEDLKVEAYVEFSNGDTKILTDEVEWSSSNDKVAVVEKGVITAISLGETYITASYKGQKAYIEIEVVNGRCANITKLVISPKIALKVEGEKQQFIAQAQMSDGKEKIVTDMAKWLSNNEEVASVNNGLAVGLADGEADIIANYGGLEAEANFLVIDQDKTKYLLVVTPKSLELSVGDSYQLLGYGMQAGKDLARNLEDVTEELIWHSADESIAIVDKGRVVGVSKGSTSVLAFGIWGAFTVTVTVFDASEENAIY
ncbi:MAG: Ig-like domain-containing protein [Cellvibrionales bacterium]|nr:Ig-like domain-containing protein [Cellvibrionales bacterium]